MAKDPCLQPDNEEVATARGEAAGPRPLPRPHPYSVCTLNPKGESRTGWNAESETGSSC